MEEVFTIDELGAATEVPTRTIRQYQTLGLLAPPSRIGRVGRYGPQHRERLAAIVRLQQRGYSLAGMRDLFAAWENGNEFRTVVGMDVRQPEAPIDEAPVLITQEQLIAMIPALATTTNCRAATKVGLVRRGPDNGQWLVRSPAGLAIVADLIANGVRLQRALSLYDDLATAIETLGLRVASELASIEPTEKRVSLLQRNRPLLGRTAATLLVTSIGEHLPVGDTPRIRVGSIEDRRQIGPRADRR